MKIDRSGDLIYWTYHMLDWSRVKQKPSGKMCVECGREMERVEDVTDSKGFKYEGLVCHHCKRVLWMRLDER